MKKVTINNAEYTLRYTLRALFIYEEITGKSYSGDRMVNSYILLCAMLMANNKDFPLTFDDVIDACDLDPSIFETFLAVLEEENKRIGMIVGKDDKKSDGKENEEVSVIRLYEEVVGRGGISPDYFFDSMTFNECAAFIRGMNRKEQEAWERTRMMMYTIAQVNSTESLTPELLFPFPWDEEREPIEIDENELKELRERAKNMEYGK